MHRGQFAAHLFRSAALGALLAAAPAVAQVTETTTQPVETVQTPEAQSQDPDDRVVITGSRIPRDAFTSTAPIQVITAEASTLEGLIDTAEILQGSTVAAGSTQFNNTFGNFVIEGGPGIASVSLETGVSVTFGVLTTDSIEQAIERAGTKAGNKGWEAAVSSIEMVNLNQALASSGF